MLAAMPANACESSFKESNLKRATIVILGILIIWAPSLKAQTGKKPLTLQDVIHSDSIIAPGISALSWRPGSLPQPIGVPPVTGYGQDGHSVNTRQLTYVRPVPGKPGASTLCAYDLESHVETLLFNPADRKEKLDLSSYQWSPRGDAILLEMGHDLWQLDPKT